MTAYQFEYGNTFLFSVSWGTSRTFPVGVPQLPFMDSLTSLRFYFTSLAEMESPFRKPIVMQFPQRASNGPLSYSWSNTLMMSSTNSFSMCQIIKIITMSWKLVIALCWSFFYSFIGVLQNSIPARIVLYNDFQRFTYKMGLSC